jgi:hypothetical protein
MHALHALRGRFDPAARAAKLAAIAALRTTTSESPESLRLAHDELLFLLAFPDDVEVRETAHTALLAIEKHVSTLPAKVRSALDDSAIGGTVSRHTFSYSAARWIAARADRVGIDWSRYRRPERLDPLLRLALHAAEADAFESGEWTTRAWLTLAAGDDASRVVEWLLHGAPGPGDASYHAWSVLYDEAEVPLNWDLAASRGGSARNVVPGPLAARAGFRRLPARPVDLIACPFDGIRRLEGAEATVWHDASAAALAARCREVLATFEANPDEIYLAALGEGTVLCILGLARPLRLALEANYGFVLFSNGVPIGYGGVTALGPQANTGLNLFPAFRGSEAGFLFAQSLRVFAGLLGTRRFVVNPVQVGKENEEALASGAFWFYDRIGFRHRTDSLQDLARRERERRAADPAYRSDAPTLETLASDDLLLTFDGWEDAPLVSERLLTTIGAHTARRLASEPAPRRERAIAELESAVAQALGGPPVDRLTESDRLGLRLLAPAFDAVGNLVRDLTPAARDALWDLVRLKGSPQEAPWARASAQAWAFWQALGRFGDTS